jgi:predicted nucleic acid-binding protein
MAEPFYGDFNAKTDIFIIADTSPLMLLSKIGHLGCMNKLFNNVWTTETIKEEYGEKLPEWIKIQQLSHPYWATLLDRLDYGVSTAFTLAMEVEDFIKWKELGGINPILILDDKKARRYIHKTGCDIKTISTANILNCAYERGFINFDGIQKIKDEYLVKHKQQF